MANSAPTLFSNHHLLRPLFNNETSCLVQYILEEASIKIIIRSGKYAYMKNSVNHALASPQKKYSPLCARFI